MIPVLFSTIIPFLILNSIPIVMFIWIGRGFIAKSKDRRETKNQLVLATVLLVLSIGLGYFIGVMATDPPTSTDADFWRSFFFIVTTPVLCLLLAIIKYLMKREFLDDK